PELGVERRDDGRALLTRRMTGGEVDHRRRYGVVQRDQVATECDVVGAELDANRRRLDGSAPGMEARQVVPEDRHVADVAAGWKDRARDPPRDACGHGARENGAGLVERAGNAYRAPVLVRAQRRVDDRLRSLPQEARHRAGIEAGPFLELGARESGAKDHDVD